MAAVVSTTVCNASCSLAELSSLRAAGNGVSAVTLPVTCVKVFKSANIARCSAQRVAHGNADIANVSRRLAIALFASPLALGSRVEDAQAAYGEAANIFASPKPQTGFTPYVGEGFQVDLPAKWNPSKEVEFPGQVLRYEDNFDATNNLSVSIVKTDKSSIKDYGSPEELLKSGGFADNKVSTAALLDSQVKELNGKVYYGVSVLTRTADGDEGGKHQLIVATIDGGKLYILKAQAGDKRWFKGAKKFVEGIISSFNVV